MVEASKLLFEKACGDAKCCELIHPWAEGCLDGTAIMLWNSIVGSYKFYAALYAVQLIINGKKLSRKYLLKQFRQYIFSGMFGFTVGTSFVTLNCILRRFCFNRFHYYTTVFLPMFISGAGIYFEPPYRRYLVNSTFVNLVFEHWWRMMEFKGYVKSTPMKETIMFMFGSSYLFYLMRQELEKSKKMSFIWFFTPPNVNKEPVTSNGYIASENKKYPSYCPHQEVCKKYVFKGTLQMFLIGCAMTMLRTIIPRLGTPVKAVRSITKKHFMLGLFLGGYIGIYRFVTCLLCRHYKKDSARHALPAGFLAGSALWFNPSISISLASITSILHILVSRMYDNKMLPENIPLPEMLYMLCQAILFHARVMHPDNCPRYIFRLMDTVTSKKVQVIYDSFLKMLISC